MHSIFFISKKEATEMEKKRKKEKQYCLLARETTIKVQFNSFLLFLFFFFFVGWGNSRYLTCIIITEINVHAMLAHNQ